MDQRRAPLGGPEQHYHLPPPPPHPHPEHSLPPSQQPQHHHQQPYPPQRPQSLPGVDTFHPPPTSHQYPGPPAQPVLLHPSSHPEGPERPEHAYTAPPAVHGTPTIKTDPPSSLPQFQRPPSDPPHPPPQPQQHHPHPPPGAPPNTRPPMEPPQAAYASHPSHPQPEHVTYVPTATMIDPYGQPHPYYPPPHPNYMPHPSLQMVHPNTRKRSMRASQACDRCRERKSKCDEQRPCATCKEQGLECNYKDTHPTKADKNNQVLSDTLDEVLRTVKELNNRISTLEKHVTGHSSRPARVDSPNGHSSDSPDSTSSVTPPVTSLGARCLLDSHTTAAHKLLLRWPSIHPFIQNRKVELQENYVMKAEDRGLLRLYGAGERTTDDKVAIGAASPAPSSHGDEWCNSPPDAFGFDMYTTEPRRSEPFAARSPIMAMDGDTIDHLFNSYKRNIHRLHPFVDTDSLGKYLQEFQRRHCADTKSSHSPLFISNGERDPKRRKRSDGYAVGLLPSEYSHSSPSQQPKHAPDRTVINAIVYLVLALGRLCDAPDPLPGPVQELGPPAAKFGAHRTAATSSASKPSPSSPRQFFNNVANSSAGVTRAQSWDGIGNPSSDKRQTQNVDEIPGFVYYREATNILGDYEDSNDLACAQARLLAGLYKGQLARVQESWSWIHGAARTCLYRLKIDGLEHSMEYYRAMFNKYYGQDSAPYFFTKSENLTLFAYWTCLQLESDILAEWDYPSSGLTLLEPRVAWPQDVISEEDLITTMANRPDEPTDVVYYYYSAQIHLRKNLNEIHAKLYGSQLSSGDSKELANRLQDYDKDLVRWRSGNPDQLAWSDDDPPATDILAARLRGKYYGARYVATRPYLDYALHVMPEIGKGRKLEELTKDANGNQRENELKLFTAMKDHMSTDFIKQKCRICIKSAMLSTVAFDGVAGSNRRLIVTNIMGTAHAQFGNMLVLSAVYNCKFDWLKELVPKERLQQLLDRTIGFIRRLQHASSVAKTDVMILETIDRTLFPGKDGSNIYENEHHTGDSFTS